MPENRGPLTLEAGAALVAHRLVKLSSGQAAYNTATATDDPIGLTLLNVKSGEDVSIDPINRGGTFEICAAGAISQGAEVYAAADGKVQALPTGAGTYRRIGLAMEAAGVDGDIIEVLPDDYVTTETVSE
ncbi:MAG: DUF2190 family protein [Deltaproteobacteria bacterium]|nr:DUF2190 family protein [Deltaproteobacteria bacterium]